MVKSQPANLDISREPGERAQDLPSFLVRILPRWGQPGWLQGNMWRTVSRSQMIAVLCRDTLAYDLLSLDWKIVETESSDPKEYADEIKEYTRLLNTGFDGIDYAGLIEWFAQDLLELPFGFAAEVGREGDKPNGKVLWIHPLDGATLFPTLNYDWPIGQSVPGYGVDPVYFPKHGIVRAYMTPRTEIQREGWGIAPPEKIYLALELLSRGDVYYANLLLDTPTAGILDLGDMEQSVAKDWLKSWQTLMTGVDAFKIPVLYEHTKDAKFISFGKPPTDLMFDTITMKYAGIVASGYGLTLEDIGLSQSSSNGGNTLAGTIRSERRSKKAGKAVVKRKFKSVIDQLLPPYLEFKFIDYDDEATVSTGRARLASAQAFQILLDKGVIIPDEARQQSIVDGLFTINMADNIKGGDKVQPASGASLDKTPARDQLGRPVTPSLGGHGEITATTQSMAQTEIYNVLNTVFQDTIQAATNVRIRRLIRGAVKASAGEVKSVLNELYYSGSDTEDSRWDDVDAWNLFYDHVLFNLVDKSEVPMLVLDALSDKEKVMTDLLNADPWWKTFSNDQKAALTAALIAAFQVGMRDTAQQMVAYLYETGGVNYSTPEVTAFDLRDPKVRSKVEKFAQDIIDRTNSGTEYYLRRITLSEVNRALSEKPVADGLNNGTLTIEQLFDDNMWMERLAVAIQSALIAILAERMKIIPMNEDLTAQRMATVEMFKRAGLTKKWWRTTSIDPCVQYCIPNQKLGFVPLSHVYPASFPEGVLQPQAHNHCACFLQFDQDELTDVLKSGKFKVWNGE